jgi:two-component system sensor histidine kinase EvgS
MLASASHELRAPTHTLSLALQSLEHPAAGPAQGEALRLAQDAVHTLGELLNDVLDAARLDSGELNLRPQVFSPREVLEQVRVQAQAWAQRKGLSLTASVGPAVPGTVQLDPLRLRQILTNLVSNAIKYTGTGSVHLSLEATHAAEGRTSLVFEVRDSGPGISAERQAQLFVPFTAADTAAAPVPEGSSGLGLNISRRLAHLMGGDILLSSEPGKGTTVRLSIPLPQVPAPSASAPAGGEGSILLCEDDPTCLLLMGQILRGHGYRVIECTGALQALEAWRAGGVRAVVTDLHMEGMDGIMLVQRVRAEMGDRQVPLLVCSGNPVPARLPGEEAPPYDAWLTKPVQMKVLLGTLADLGIHAPPAAPRPEIAGATGGD